jgi:hypothetical protein
LISKDFIGKNAWAQYEKVGKVKELGIDSETWTVNRLEAELTKEMFESALGSKFEQRGGVRNMLTTTAIETGNSCWSEKGLQLKVSKDQLHMYLRAP